jgi:hypothetical protein
LRQADGAGALGLPLNGERRTTVGMENYSAHQQKIIKRYYDNQDTIQLQRLSELVTDLFLAEGKKRQTVWKRIVSALEKLKVPADRIQNVQSKDDPKLLAKLVQELQGR